jgi:hypothetical protein
LSKSSICSFLLLVGSFVSEVLFITQFSSYVGLFRRLDHLLEKWDAALRRHPGDAALWLRYLTLRQGSFSKFTFATVAEEYARAGQVLLENYFASGLEREHLEEAMLHVHIRASYFYAQSGAILDFFPVVLSYPLSSLTVSAIHVAGLFSVETLAFANRAHRESRCKLSSIAGILLIEPLEPK